MPIPMMPFRGDPTTVVVDGSDSDVAAALLLAEEQSPEYAVVDLKMPGESGLVLIGKLLARDPHTRVVMLTGYASIATAVEAIKLGALHYLAKPCDADQVGAALLQQVLQQIDYTGHGTHLDRRGIGPKKGP